MDTMAFNTDTVDWREARQWLIDSGVIPPTHRVTKPDITLVDFARSLRDGVFLCSLLNKLKPDCVDYSARPVMQHNYLYNISAFLNACKVEFSIKDNDLFTESELYDVDNFSKVMLALSKLSFTQQALSMGWKPFPSEDTKESCSDVSGEDIYASLQDVSAQKAVYANVQDLYQDSGDDDSFGYGDEKIYDSIFYYQSPPVKPNDRGENKVMELYETEKSFLSVLETISFDYFDALKDQQCLDDLKLVFEIANKVLPFHVTLRDGLKKCIDSKASDTSEVAHLFFEAEEGLLKYGMYAAYVPEAQERAKMFQNKGDTSKVMSVTMEKSKQQRFPLSDLLAIPVQRVMRYPLLVKDMEKCIRKSNMPSQTKLQQLQKLLTYLEDVIKHINITKEHFESKRAIQDLESNMIEYKGPKLSTECGHYHMDGELKIKVMDGSKDKEEPRSRWVFLFDKILLITSRKVRITRRISYVVKAFHEIADITLIDPVSSKGRYSFRIRIDGREPCEYMAFAKNEQLKFKWRDSINKARDVINPKAGKRRHHSFELVNFETPERCNHCQNLLHGCYFQGYRCTECKVISHPHCLENQSPCSAVKPRRPPHPAITGQASLDTLTSSRTKRLNGSENTEKRKLYIANQKYNAIGPRRDTFLTFDRGDEIIIVKDNDPEWWEGVLVKTGQRGYVSQNYLKKPPSPLQNISTMQQFQQPVMAVDDILVQTRKRLSEFSWYVGMKTRIDAEVALHRVKDGVFLIRESMDRPGEYAVALKWNNMPKHIKIMKNPHTDRFYVSDACDFNSIEELVSYYQQNTLGVSFPGVDTTLRYPYTDYAEGRIGLRHLSVSSSGPTLNPPNFPAPHPQNASLMSPPPYDGFWGEAVRDFEGDGAGQLSFQKHDHVKVITKETQRLGWWYGECNGKSGYFRGDYIVPIIK